MTEEIKNPNGVNGINGSRKLSKISQAEKETVHEEREKWGSKAEFLLSCIGLSVGIGNVWRFPYLAYQNGGGAFFIAYAIMLLVAGKPLFFAELALGQFTSCNTLRVWRCFPLAKGVGFAMIIMSVLIAIYYNVIMSYTLYYIAQSCRSVVPWKECYEWWGADNNCYVRASNQTACRDVPKLLAEIYSIENGSHYNASSNPEDALSNFTIITWSNKNVTVPYNVYNDALSTCHNSTQTASEQFWERYVLQLTDGLDDLGSIKWDLALTLFICWMIVFLGLCKGIKSSGKVVYATATFPYVILITLVIYGCMLPGAIDGLKYFFVPDWSKLLRIESTAHAHRLSADSLMAMEEGKKDRDMIAIDPVSDSDGGEAEYGEAAAEQLLFSLSIGAGALIMYSSYNNFENNVYRDAVFVSILDFATSIMSGVVIFAVLGNMATEMKLDIDKVAKGGQGLAFVTYPEALARLPVAQLWSVLFFFMLFLLAIDSEFSYLENLFSCVFDASPYLKRRKTIVTFGFCMLFFLLGLPCVTQGGQYVLNLMDRYGGGNAGLIIATFEIIALMWGYGVENFMDDMEFMLGFRLSRYWQICWKYVSPIVLAFVVIYGMCVHKPITYGDVPYPSWGDTIGWILTLISVLQIPLWAGIVLYQNRKDWRRVLRPHPNYGPADPEMSRIYRLKFPREEESEMKGVINVAMDPVTDDIR